VADKGEILEIGEALQSLLVSEGMEDLVELIYIKEVWPELVGEKIAGEAKPYRLEGGRLYIGVRSHAWAQELHYRKEGIRKGIKEKTGTEIMDIIVKKVTLK
jgi:predicted nucleic acid-binding Zn ribbon protein